MLALAVKHSILHTLNVSSLIESAGFFEHACPVPVTPVGMSIKEQ